MWVLERTRAQVAGLWWQAPLPMELSDTSHPYKKDIHSFIHLFFDQKLTDHLLCASTALDARTRKCTVWRTSLPTYII